MGAELILITGGARSGKSAFAERIAAHSDRVLFVATAEALDEDMARRIDAHQRSRPSHWDTLEEPLALAQAIDAHIQRETRGYNAIIVDCLTLWVSNMLLAQAEDADAEADILTAAQTLLDARSNAADATRWIIVTNEVGLGVVPSSSLGRAYRDALGRVNSLVAARADKVYLMVAGIALELKSLGAQRLNEMDMA